MKLNDCLKEIKDLRKCDVRFYEVHPDWEGQIHVTTANVIDLYNDWWGDCNMVPENGEYIYAISFYDYSGRSFVVDSGKQIQFQDLMGAITERVKLDRG